MTHASSILLAPFILAFLVFVFRFYNREHASSAANPSFLLAILTVFIAGSYLVLGVLDSLPPYSTIGFAIIGLVLLATGIVRLFML